MVELFYKFDDPAEMKSMKSICSAIDNILKIAVNLLRIVEKTLDKYENFNPLRPIKNFYFAKVKQFKCQTELIFDCIKSDGSKSKTRAELKFPLLLNFVQFMLENYSLYATHLMLALTQGYYNKLSEKLHFQKFNKIDETIEFTDFKNLRKNFFFHLQNYVEKCSKI